MKKNFETFRYSEKETIAKLDGMKSIMRVTTPRKVEWWLVLPARGDSDAVCVLIQKSPKWEIIKNVEAKILAEYAERIINA